MPKIYMILLLLVFTSCNLKLGRNDRVRRNVPAITIQDFLYAFTETAGYREWELKASQAKIYEGSDDIELHNFTMTFFSASNSIRSVLIANKGFVNQTTRNLEALGEVHILSSNQSELITEKVFWNQETKLFYSETNKVVTFIRPAQKILGYNMVADSQLNEVTLENSLGQVELKESDNPDRANVPDDNTEFDIKPALVVPDQPPRPAGGLASEP
ncbi:MAG: LPS export ABC transporter periplasmic protein LptC [Brevinema sp.]